MDVKVGCEVVNMGADRIALCVDTKQSDHGLACVLLLVLHAVHVWHLLRVVIAVNLHKLNQVSAVIQVGTRWTPDVVLARKVWAF